MTLDFISPFEGEIIWKIALAMVLGLLVGLDREYRGKGAGLRTYALVCMGAALFVALAFAISETSSAVNDPLRVVHAVALGVGFIGAGLIIQRQSHVEGLTSASGLWATAAIGAAVGAGFPVVAFFSALLIVFLLAVFKEVEKRFLRTL